MKDTLCNLRFRQFVAFRMHPGAVERISYLSTYAERFDANETCALNKSLFSYAAYSEQILARLKRPLFVAIFNDLLGFLLREASNVSAL